MSTLNIDINESVVNKVRVKPDAAINNLLIVELESVEVDTKLSEDTKEEYDFHGMVVPSIYFSFKQHHSDGIERFYTYSLSPVVITKKDGNPNPNKTRQNIYLEQYKHIRHIFNAFANEPNVMDISKFKLPELKIDEPNKEKHLKDVKKWYDALATLFTDKDGKALYKNAKDEGIKLLMKMVINKNDKKINIPNYLNDGFAEKLKLVNNKVVTALQIEPNESIVYQAVGGGAMPGTSMPGAAPTSDIDLDAL